MKLDLVEQVARSVMYEGYMLYPYTATAVKNQHRWNFGVLYPPAYDTALMQTDCLAQAGPAAVLTASVRFLQLEGEQAVERRIDVDFPVGSGRALKEFAFSEVRGEIEMTAGLAAESLCRFRHSDSQPDFVRRGDPGRRARAIADLGPHHSDPVGRRVRLPHGSAGSVP